MIKENYQEVLIMSVEKKGDHAGNGLKDAVDNMKLQCISSRIDETYINNDIDLLLLGKTGGGKSSTGNSILNKDVFEIADCLHSVTKDIQCQSSMFNDRKIKVVDGPGFEDTDDMDDMETSITIMIDKMTEAILEHTEGYHAFILVLKYGGRFTKEDKFIIEMLRSIFGEKVVRHYCILLLTHGDVYRTHKLNKNKTFKAWCSEQKGIFKGLLEECGHRVVLFDNNTDDPIIKENQLKELILIIDNLQFHGRRYCDDNFKEAKERRKVLLLTRQVERITEKTRQDHDLLMKKINNTNALEPDQQIQELTTIAKECSNLQNELKYSDEDTHIFKLALDLLSNIDLLIKSKLNTAQRLKEKLDMEQEKNQLEKKLQEILFKSTKSQEDKKHLEKQLEELQNKLSSCEEEIKQFDNDLNILTQKSIPSVEQIKHASLKTFCQKMTEETEKLEKELQERTGTLGKRIKNLFMGAWRKLTT